jgi:hypothetical protein
MVSSLRIDHQISFCPIVIQRRPSKLATNRSKTAVMDVIGSLCISLGTSTVQLHDSLRSRRSCACSEAGFSSQNGDRASEVYCRRAVFCCTIFCGQNDWTQCFLFMVGSVCGVKRFTTESRNSLKDVRRSHMITDQVALVRKSLRQQSKISVLRVSTHWSSDGINLSMLVEDTSRNKCFFFPNSNVTCFTFYIHLWPIYWLSLVVSGVIFVLLVVITLKAMRNEDYKYLQPNSDRCLLNHK